MTDRLDPESRHDLVVYKLEEAEASFVDGAFSFLRNINQYLRYYASRLRISQRNFQNS